MQRIERGHALGEIALERLTRPARATSASTRARSASSCSFGNRADNASTPGLKYAIVAAMSSASRRERRNHVVPRSNWPLVLMSIADCTASSTLLSSASIAIHNGTSPKTSRLSR